MTTPINLNKARKARKRSEDRGRAEANSVKFGRSKAEKEAARRANDKAARDLNGHKRET